ncbi:hypothetical protein AGMMS49942_24270 [Spirochaetia bacterium]|nr:hypothetical protein AGMMS49942_24270 [Spirochaetia bacterium]
MDQAVRNELKLLTDIIVNTLPVEQVILFGSYAYGTPHKDSDLDLYVVLKDSVEMRELDAACKIRLAMARKKSMPVDLIVKKQSAFLYRKTRPSIDRFIANNGVVLYG